MSWLGLWTLMISGAAAAEDCPQPVSTATLAQHISGADLAFSSMDENAFRTARWTAQRAVGCMGEAIQTGQVAAYYRMEALGSFLDQNHAQTVGFFKSMLKVAPHYMLPEAMAPESHPLRVDFQVAQGSTPVAGDPVQRPSNGLIRVDGGVATEFPRDRPYLFQHQDGDGVIKSSTVVGIGVKTPHYATARGFQTENSGGRQVTNIDKVKRKGPAVSVNVPLAVISGGSALVSGITYVVAMSRAAEFHDSNTPTAKLGELRDDTNTLVWVSGTFATVAVGTGVAAFVVGGAF
jgi:hypothetical protein